MERSEQKDILRNPSRTPSSESLSLLSADLLAVVVSRESRLLSLRRQEISSEASFRMLSKTPSPTPSMPRERLLPLSMLSTLSREMGEISTASVDEDYKIFNSKSRY